MNRMIKYDIQETMHFQKHGKMVPLFGHCHDFLGRLFVGK